MVKTPPQPKQSFKSYLTHISTQAKAKKLQRKLRIVIGNTSCDLDSCIGALVLAYYYSRVGGKEFLPVVNCRREDFRLNLEANLHLITDCKLNINDLVFVDELRNLYKPSQIKETVLVDHNVLDISQQDMGKNVTRIIDHHVDMN